jgi:hypothetical protein
MTTTPFEPGTDPDLAPDLPNPVAPGAPNPDPDPEQQPSEA